MTLPLPLDIAEESKTVVSEMATRRGLWGMVATVVGVSVAVVALFVGIRTYLLMLPGP